jgi:hypothetical protein
MADFDGDGKLDLAVGAGNVLLLGNAAGHSKRRSCWVLAVSIAVGDFNLDGKPDLAVGGVTVLLNISVFPTTSTHFSSNPPLGRA